MVAWSGEIAEEIMRNDQIFDVKVRLAGMCEKKRRQGHLQDFWPKQLKERVTICSAE